MLTLAAAFGLGWYFGSNPNEPRANAPGAARRDPAFEKGTASKTKLSEQRDGHCEAVLEGFERACLPLLGAPRQGSTEQCLAEVGALRGRVASAATLKFLSRTHVLLETSRPETSPGNRPASPGPAELSDQPHQYD